MGTTKIAVVGGASSTFTPKLFRDMAHYKDLAGSELTLIDVDEDRLEVFRRLAERVSAAGDVDYTVRATTDRRAGLEGADTVIVSFAVKRNELWKVDFDVPRKHGIRHITGECGGPGALFHAFRNIPIMMEVAADVEAVCPDALVMVCTNPEARLVMALDQHANVRTVGLCHGVEIVLQWMGPLVGVSPDDLEVTAAGVNHFTWILKLVEKATERDVLPDLREAMREKGPDFFPLTQKLWDLFGVCPSPGDAHVGEFLQHAWELCGLNGPGFGGRHQQDRWEELVRQSTGDAPLDEYLGGRTWADTLAYPIINGVVNDVPTRMPALNLSNEEGWIANLPDDAVVEVPANADGSGLHPEAVGELPSGIAALCRREIDMQRLNVEAALTGDRALAKQAFLIDPVVASLKDGEAAFEELMAAQGEHLPQFST